MIRQALNQTGAAYTEADGEAAFYGPKIDLQVRDPQGREETLSTIQVDLLLPERFGLGYQRDNQEQRPIMVHRSVISTMERMVAHVLEVHDGALPAWLSPTQVLVLPASADARDHANAVRDRLAAEGLRADLDERDSTWGLASGSRSNRRSPIWRSSGHVSNRLRRSQSDCALANNLPRSRSSSSRRSLAK